MITAAAGEPLLVPELATVVPGPPGATVAGKEVGVGKPPCSAWRGKILRHFKNIQPMYLLAGSRCGRCAGRAAAAEVADEAPAGLVEGGGHEGGVHGQRAQPHAHARHGPAAGLAAAWKCWTHFSTQARELDFIDIYNSADIMVKNIYCNI